MYDDDRIVKWAQRGRHIPLRCTECGQTGTTKNIGWIGARTIFVACECSVRKLEIVAPPNVAELEEQDRLECEEAERCEEFVNAHVPTFKELHKEYAGRPFRFFQVHSTHARLTAVALDLYKQQKEVM